MQFTITADHPSLPGHFPRYPVVPGVVILSYVLEVLAKQAAPQAVTGIRRVKFLQPVLPGQTLRLELGVPQPGRLPFKCWLDVVLVVEGLVTLLG